MSVRNFLVLLTTLHEAVELRIYFGKAPKTKGEKRKVAPLYRKSPPFAENRKGWGTLKFTCVAAIARSKSTGKRACATLFPAGEDAVVFLLGCFGGIFRRFIAAGNFSEHGGNNPGFEGFVNGGGAIARIADVGGPIEDVA